MPSDALLDAFRLQAGGCKLFGSPLYERLCTEAVRDLERGGPVWRLVADWSGDPLRSFLALRVLGAVHERVLAGAAPELARFYPSAGGTPGAWPEVWEAFAHVVNTQRDALRRRLDSFPQTNEVRRCAGLLPGFLVAAHRTGLPLRIREIGASAGLNLLWDRFRYELGPHRWGDPASPVAIRAGWEGPAAPFEAGVSVESRAGCDLEPRDVRDPEQARLLEAFVWPDQTDRLEPLRAAAALAREEPPRLERASAGEWLARELSEPARGVTRVVFHSAFWIYVGNDEQRRIRALLASEGARATPETPLAWLRHEDDPERVGAIDVRLTLWPGGEDLVLADSHPHGRRVAWRAGAQPEESSGGSSRGSLAAGGGSGGNGASRPS